jgi:paraquat-inducible protein B
MSTCATVPPSASWSSAACAGDCDCRACSPASCTSTSTSIPDKPAVFAALDPDLSEIPTIRTAVQELTTKLEGFPMDKFLADVAAISGAVNKLMSAQATQDLPQRLDVTLRHLQSLAARFDAQGGPILNDVRGNLAEMNKALLAAQAALAKLDTAADRVADLASRIRAWWQA